MKNAFHLYLDDSGTRHPNKKMGRIPGHKHDYFSLGGVLVRNEVEEETRRLHARFCEDWGIDYPLHSVEIRGKTGHFFWLKDLSKEESNRFHEELYQVLREAPVIGLACVIDRPGYLARYKEKYKGMPWMLCKTAFNIVVERAAKIARMESRPLRVRVEKCNKTEDKRLKRYYEKLLKSGQPFNPETSKIYGPLSSEEFKETLKELRLKEKSSPMVQFADLYLWPMCLGGYDPGNRPYARLMQDEKLVDCVLDQDLLPVCGIKYSCFEIEWGGPEKTAPGR